MKPHIHTDIVHIAVLGTATLLWAHFLRMIGAYLSSHGMRQLGVPLGSLATLGS